MVDERSANEAIDAPQKGGMSIIIRPALSPPVLRAQCPVRGLLPLTGRGWPPCCTRSDA